MHFQNNSKNSHNCYSLNERHAQGGKNLSAPNSFLTEFNKVLNSWNFIKGNNFSYFEEEDEPKRMVTRFQILARK